jgi:hypothetical protein
MLWTRFGQDQVFPNDEEIRKHRNTYPTLKAYEALPAARRGSMGLIAAHYRFNELQPRFPHARYITFVRDPIDRTISEVLHIKRHAKRFSECTEEQIIAYLAKSGGRFGLNVMCRYLALIYPFVRKPHTLQELVTSGMRTIRDITAVGLYERFDESVDLIASSLDLDLGRPVKLNVAPQRLSARRRAELTEIIRPHVALDRMIYDFACAEFDKRLISKA